MRDDEWTPQGICETMTFELFKTALNKGQEKRPYYGTKFSNGRDEWHNGTFESYTSLIERLHVTAANSSSAAHHLTCQM